MESPGTIPFGMSILPSAWLRYGKERQRFTDLYPQFFSGRHTALDRIYENMPATYQKGRHADEWSCVKHKEIDGAEAIVKEHPVQSEEDIFNLKIPDCRKRRS